MENKGLECTMLRMATQTRGEEEAEMKLVGPFCILQRGKGIETMRINMIFKICLLSINTLTTIAHLPLHGWQAFLLSKIPTKTDLLSR